MIPKQFCKTKHFYESYTYTFFYFYWLFRSFLFFETKAIIGPNANLSKSDAGYYGFLDSNLSLSFQG